MTFGELADKVREIHEGNERDFGPMEVKVAVRCFELPFHDIVVGKYGQFWDRPHPLGYRPKKKSKGETWTQLTSIYRLTPGL